MTAAFQHHFAAMTTQCELQFYGVSAADGEALARQIKARVAQLVSRYNFYSPDSWLNVSLNGRRGDQVELDEECAAILQLVRTHSANTFGAFDISVGTFARAVREASSLEEVHQIRSAALAWVGPEHWWLEGNRLHFDNPYTRFDLGGVIKEFAVDEAVRLARAAGIESGLINFGGDLAGFGLKPSGERFVVAIPDPFQPEQMLFGLDLENQALTTSGHYARQRQLGDGALSHVLSRHSALPQQQGWLSASVLSPSALISGIYSTSLLIRKDIHLPADVLAVVVDEQRRLFSLPQP